jgi:hypothetical protein
MYPYRVFISYSHVDAALAERVRTRVGDIGAVPMSDADIMGGARFTEDIRKKISHAHVFISLLTKNSKERPWVHQELGYAMGLAVPVLPLALDELPDGMAQEIQAVKVSPRLDDLDRRLTGAVLENAVWCSRKEGKSTFECADLLRHRTEMLVDNAESLLRTEGPCKIRQRMAFSSFSLPKKSPTHADWDVRDGENRRSPEVRDLLRREREVFEAHARDAECDLMIDPYVSAEEDRAGSVERSRFKHGREATLKRLEILHSFLTSMPDDKVRVVLQKGRIEGSIVTVGDWFSAEAVVPHYKGGYKQTILTRHAPTVLGTIQRFDREFDEALTDANLRGLSSRVAALQIIDTIREEKGHGPE